MRGFFSAIIFGAVLVLGAGCTTVQTVEQPQEPIVYGTDADPAFIAESELDCQEKGGTFNECGSMCPEGEICAAVCAAVCEF